MDFDDFRIILGIVIPIDELIFFRGFETTNQLVFVSIFFKRTKKTGYHVFSICLLDITFNDTDLVPPRWQCLVLQ